MGDWRVPSFDPIPDARPHVIVVGGGVAGLVAARTLADRGLRVTLLEAGDRLGGKIAAHVVGGIELDAGAESFATRGGVVAALAAELGLAVELVQPIGGGAWIQPAAGPAVPLPKAGILGIPSVPLARDVIAVVGLAGAFRAQLDALLSGFVGSRERSLGALVRKRMGRAVLDRLVVPVAGAIHAAHPDDLDVDRVAPRLRSAMLSEGSLEKAVLTLREAAPAGSAVQGVVGGVVRLVEALERDITGRVEIVLGASVAQADATGVVVTDGTVHPSDAVVLAAGPDGHPGIPIIVATLVVRCAALDESPRGSGVLVAPGSHGVRAKAITHLTSKWQWVRDLADGAHVLRLSYEGDAPADDSALAQQARRDAERLLGVTIPETDVLAFDRVTWQGPTPTGTPVSTPAGVVRVGELVSGTGLAAVIGHSSREARRLADRLAGEPALRLGGDT